METVGDQLNPFERLEAVVLVLEQTTPGVPLARRSLNGTRGEGDQLIVERRVDSDHRIVRVGASDRTHFSFYWAFLPPPGAAQECRHGEGNLYGNIDYFRYFLERFLIECADWREIPRCNIDGTPPDGAD